MKKLSILLVYLLLTSASQAKLPNIVLIMADDIGPGDIAFYHRERTGQAEVIPTPNLDQLISQGMRFDDAHSAASLCAPSRFGMLTGCYSYRNYQPYGVWGPWNKTGVTKRFTTSARILQQAGYATAFFGKSGMGGGYPSSGIDAASKEERYKEYDLTKRIDGPNQLGFDYSFELPSGIQGTPLMYYENADWYPIAEDSTMVSIPPAQSAYDKSYKHQDWVLFGDSNWDPTLAGGFLAGKAQEYIAKHVAENPDQPFFIYYCSQAVHIPHTPPAELDGEKIAGSTGSQQFDMVREIDVQVAMIDQALKEAGVVEDTLFIFTSDNGGLAVRTEFEKNSGHDPTNGWKGLKGAIAEGGHRIPFIVRWPGVVEANTKSDAPINALDTVATFAAVTGQEISRNQVMDSLNLLPLLKQEAGASGHETLIHYASFGGCVIREGDWKLYLWGKPGKPGMKKVRPTKLFNLADNPGEDEERNLIEDPKQAERIEEMTERFQYSLKKPTVRP